MDKIHEELRSKIDELGKKIRSLQNLKEYNQLQDHRLYLLKKPDKDGKIDIEALKQKELIATLRTSEEIDEEIASIQNTMIKITEEYWSKDFVDEPLRLNTIKRYGNKYCELRQHPNGNWYLYENSEYATPSLKIIFNEAGIPVKIERYIQGVETDGRPTKHIQDIILDQPVPVEAPKDKPKFEYLPTIKPLSNEEKLKILGYNIPATTKETENTKKESTLARKVRSIFERD